MCQADHILMKPFFISPVDKQANYYLVIAFSCVFYGPGNNPGLFLYNLQKT
jgi:hypothetical protein